ncbi:MAG TPA: lytic transglycosylase domain-containing protein [Paraburkholderia sp.]
MRIVGTVLAVVLPLCAVAQQGQPVAQSDAASFTELAQTCAPHVDTQTLAAVVRVESSFNPYAIGVVGGHLQRQPRSYAEAVATAHGLEARGFDFSVGLGQINVRNLPRFGETIETIFEPCRNLRASGAILAQCFARSARQTRDEQGALRGAFSCYYSGNFSTGYQHGYVARVIAGAYTNARQAARGSDVAALPIAVVRASDPGAPMARTTHAPGSESTEAAATMQRVSQARAANAQPAFSSHASVAQKGKVSSRSTATTQPCRAADARQSITIRCADNASRWCTRCLGVTTLAAH